MHKCDYHIVWTAKYRFRVLLGEVKELVEPDIKILCERKGSEIVGTLICLDCTHPEGYAPIFLQKPPALQVVVY